MLECEALGDSVAIYKDLPSEGGENIFSWATYPPIDTPTSFPTNEPGECDTIVFMESGDELLEQEAVVTSGYYLFQDENGNLEIRQGSPDDSGDLVWATDVQGDKKNSFSSILQDDGNLITYEADKNDESVLWSSESAGESSSYFFLLQCPAQVGESIAIYDGRPNQGGQLVKSWETLTELPSTNEPSKSPSSEPSTSPSSEPTQCNDPSIFLESNDNIDEGTALVRNNVYLTQRYTGNLEIREGTPNSPGDLIWQSGVNESPDGFRYYTKLQGDGHLITWAEDDSSGVRSPVWRSFAWDSNGSYFFLLECLDQGGNVGVYKGDPSNGGVPIWESERISSTRRMLRSGRL